MSVAVAERVRLERIHEMRGLPPAGYATWEDFSKSFDFFEGITYEELTAGDPDPMFMVFDILYVEAQSRNGLVYDEPLVTSITTQMPGKGAKLGHSDMWGGNGTPEDDADWVGLKRVGNIVYAKLFVPQGKARTQMARIKRRGGKIKTSFEGYGVSVPIFDDQGDDTGLFRLKDFELGSIDLVRDIDAALADYQTGEPIFTSETMRKQKDKPMSDITLKDVPEAVRQQIIAEAKLQADAAKVAEIKAELDSTKKDLTDAQAKIATLETAAADTVKVIAEKDTALKSASDRIATFEKAAFDAALDEHVASFFPWKVNTATGKATLESMKANLRTLILAQVKETSMDAVKAVSQSIYDTNLKVIAEATIKAVSGGSAVVPGKQPDGTRDNQIDALLKEFEGRYAPANGRK